MKRLSLSLVLIMISIISWGSNARYRVMFRSNPATSMTIGWDQTGGSNPVVHYGTVDHGRNANDYAFTQGVSRNITHKGMNNHFARLTGLQPNTAYYFVIKDSQGTSNRFWFKTAPGNSGEQLSFIAGGDSRNNRTPRKNANKLVAKLRPHAVLFGGDMTNRDTNAEWLDWMNDWQLTTGSDGRMIPIVAARGNHEGSNNSIYHLFDVPSASVYYALTFGGDLIRSYTLNTEISISGNQTAWLNNDLAANPNVIWKMAQYHKPMRPHASFKSEGNNQYNNWAVPFFQNNVKLVVECDAHVVKSTWPVVPSTGAGSDEGFKRDDVNGTVYSGEGCWGAPLRGNNDNKAWTRASGRFNQFKWIFVNSSRIEVRTIKVDNADQVGQVSDNNIFAAPANLDVWNPSTGSVVTILAPSSNRTPTVSITSPTSGTHYNTSQTVNVSANASDSDGSISKVEFFVDGVKRATDYSAPYAANLSITDGIHQIVAKAIDNEGATKEDEITVTAGLVNETFEKRVVSGDDDVEENNSNGSIYSTSSDLELSADGSNNQTIGIRFTNVVIPQGATINKAYIQFTTDERNSGVINLLIKGEDSNNSSVFTSGINNVSNRTTTSATANWSPSAWNTVGASGAAQRTPELKSVVTEITSRSGWTSGNAMSFIITGTGERTAESYNGSSSKAPLLHIEYTIGGNNPTPNIDPIVSVTSPANNSVFNANLNDNITISANASDTDGSISQVEFLQGSTVIGTDNSAPYAINAVVNGFGNFTYTVRATDNEGAVSTSSITVKINEMVTTPTTCSNGITSYPYTEGFENTLGAWSQVSGDDMNWSLLSGGTPSSGTGPSSAIQGNHYVYVEASNPNYPGKLALLESPCFDLSAVTNPELSFKYHMNGTAIGTLSIEISTDNGASWSELWSRSGSQGNSWKTLSEIDLSNYSSAKLRFRGLTGSGWSSDLAIDDFRIASAGSTGGGTPSIVTIEKRVIHGRDDAEERANGSMYLNSSDLELVDDQTNQKVGIRFRGLNIPQGAVITKAYIQFTVDETKNTSGAKTIKGEDKGNASIFGSALNNISSRTKTSASVSWNPNSWQSVGDAGSRQRTNDLTSIVQEIVNRNDWSLGNSMAFIISGSGRRVAESYNGSSSKAPLLHVEYETSSNVKEGVYLSSNEELTNMISIYPNPASDWLNIENMSESAGEVSILSINGREVKSESIVAGDITSVDVRELSSGIYIIQMNFGDRQKVIQFRKD